MLGPLQAFVGANNTDVVPHEAADFIPVMGDYDFFIRVRNLAFIPFRQRGKGRRPVKITPDIFVGGMGEYYTFQQGITRHAVCAMESGTGYLADCIKRVNISPPVFIDNHTATSVMGGRHYGDSLSGQVKSILNTTGIYGGEVVYDEIFSPVTDIEVYTLATQTLHFMVNSPCDNVPGGQLST